MKALILGGAGFVGSHLCQELISRGREIIVLDDLSAGKLENIKEGIDEDKIKFVKRDVRKWNKVAPLVEEYEEVYHLAAIVGVKRVIKDPIKCVEVGVRGARNVIETSMMYNRRLFMASTSQVYGVNAGICGESQQISLGRTLVWTYAAAKALDEYLALAAYKMHGLRVTVGRFFNIIGTRQGLRSGHVLPTFVNQALKGEDITIYGTGRQIRSFLYVKEAVKAVVDLMETDKSIGEIYNIGTNVSYSIIQLAEIVKETLNSKSKITYVPYREAYQVNGYDDVNFRLAETTKIKSVIQFNPKKKLEDIILEIAVEMGGFDTVYHLKK
jgi:UDP-glucose 4-epimerase